MPGHLIHSKIHFSCLRPMMSLAFILMLHLLPFNPHNSSPIPMLLVTNQALAYQGHHLEQELWQDLKARCPCPSQSRHHRLLRTWFPGSPLTTLLSRASADERLVQLSKIKSAPGDTPDTPGILVLCLCLPHSTKCSLSPVPVGFVGWKRIEWQI